MRQTLRTPTSFFALAAACTPSLALVAQEPLPSETELQIEVERGEDRLTVRAGGELFTEYRFTGSTKPYLYPLLAPGGVPVTRAWPMEERDGEERDHPHQRSLWFAHGSVNGRDFWHEGSERIEHTGDFKIVREGPTATVRSQNRWLDAEGSLVCTEERAMTFRAFGDRRMVDFELRIRAPAERSVTFGDTKEGTFALRLAPELGLSGARARGRALSSEGERDGACWGKRARWLTYSATIGERELGVAIFDHPENPAHPTRWHARDYGLFAANPFGLHDFEGAPEGAGERVIAAGESLTFRYRVLLYTGPADPDVLERRYREYSGDPPPK